MLLMLKTVPCNRATFSGYTVQVKGLPRSLKWLEGVSPVELNSPS